jgi:hypothetical protein
MTCYIDKRNYVSIGQTRIEPILAIAKQHVNTLLLDGLRVQFQNVLMALSLAINLVRPGGRLQ